MIDDRFDEERDLDRDDPFEERAPICPACGVTALPADPSHVIDTRFVCENPDCEADGEQV
jgi:hypothetical protein